MLEKSLKPGLAAGRPAENVRPRALAAGLLLALGICILTPYNNVLKQATPLGGGHFPLAPFFVLIWLTVLSAAWRAWGKGRLLFTGRELLFVWILMVLVSGVAYTGLARTFFINLTAPFHFSTPGNRWQEVLQPLLPPALYPRDPEAVRLLYNGLAGGREMGWTEVLFRIPWGVWVGPLLIWGGFVLLAYLVMICLVNLISRQWIHNERMNFPLLQVPLFLEEALDGGRLRASLANGFFVAGVLIPVLLHLLNGLHAYFPAVPQVPTLILAGPYFPKYGLFAGFHKLKIYLYPAFIGFAFLASRQVSFSFWFFFLLGGLLVGLLDLFGYRIPAASLGTVFGPTLARPEEAQMIGAYLVFFLFLVWLARRHLWETVREAFGAAPAHPARTEWLGARVAFWGFWAGFLGLALWCVLFGMALVPALTLIASFLVILVVASRVVCQGGVAYFTLNAAPMDALITLGGARFFAPAGLLLGAVTQKALFVDLRESLMPSLVHGSRLTGRMAGKGRILGGLGLVLVLGVAVSLAAMLALCYRYGIREMGLEWATRTTVAVYENVFNIVQTPVEASAWVRGFIILGGAVMLALVACYHRFYWWPVHPIGYLMTYSSAMWILWFSFLAGWLANALCMRYGGVKLFKKLRLFFIGLIIGDFFMGGVFASIGFFTDVGYMAFPD